MEINQGGKKIRGFFLNPWKYASMALLMTPGNFMRGGNYGKN